MSLQGNPGTRPEANSSNKWMDRWTLWAWGGSDVLSFAGWALQQSAGSSSRAELKLPGNLHPGSSSHISQDFPLKVCRLQGRGAQNTLRSHPG